MFRQPAVRNSQVSAACCEEQALQKCKVKMHECMSGNLSERPCQREGDKKTERWRREQERERERSRTLVCLFHKDSLPTLAFKAESSKF